MLDLFSLKIMFLQKLLFCFFYIAWMSFRKLLDKNIRKIPEIAEQTKQQSLFVYC